MLSIASQTAGPNGLKFLEKPVSTSGVAKAKKDFIKKSILFFQKSIFVFYIRSKKISRAKPSTSASYYYYEVKWACLMLLDYLKS